MRHAHDLLRKLSKLLHHSVDNVLQLHCNDALDGDRNPLGQIASCDGVAHAGDVLDLIFEEPEFLGFGWEGGGSCDGVEVVNGRSGAPTGKTTVIACIQARIERSRLLGTV
jgi:hypothetical protein